MTPSEIIEMFHKDGPSFLNSLDEEDLWAFMNVDPEVMVHRFWSVGGYVALQQYVVVELMRSRAANFDTWNNLLALDLDIKQEWIEALRQHFIDEKPMPTWISAEVMDYLQERKWAQNGDKYK